LCPTIQGTFLNIFLIPTMSWKFCPCHKSKPKIMMNNFGKRNCMQLVGSSTCAQGAPNFFLLGWGGGWEVFSQFPFSQCVLIKFPMNFHQVPKLFPNRFSITPLFIPYVLANVILMSRKPPHFYFGLLHMSSLRVILDKGPKTKSLGTNLKQIELWRITLKKHFFLRYNECVERLGVQFKGSNIKNVCLTCGRIRLTFGVFSLLLHGF
jgi:hypothetical protein